MSYVLQDTRTGKYVAYPHSNGGASFTNKLQNARVYPTKEVAERDRCPQSERVVRLEDAMQGGRFQ